MTEAEITYQLSELFNRWWVINQWWVSISFGLLVVAYFAADRLNYVLITIILVLYSAFSLWMWALVTFNETIMAGFDADLAALQSAGSLSSQGAEMFIAQDVLARFSFWGLLARYGTFASVILYVTYSGIQARRKSSELIQLRQ